MPNTMFLRTPLGVDLAYVHVAGDLPTVVFLGGYRSDMQGTKALYLDQYCRNSGHAFLRLDYSGHGESGGEFEKGTIGRWVADARFVIDAMTSGPLVLVGSSMGGWIMLQLALSMPEKIQGLVGVAAAPDFTRDLIQRDMSAKERDSLERDGKVEVCSEYDPQGYTVTRTFIEEGDRHIVLDSPIELNCPVRLLQGMNDEEVPWQTAIRIAEVITESDVRVVLQKNGDHRLSEPKDLQLLGSLISEVLTLSG